MCSIYSPLFLLSGGNCHSLNVCSISRQFFVTQRKAKTFFENNQLCLKAATTSLPTFVSRKPIYFHPFYSGLAVCQFKHSLTVCLTKNGLDLRLQVISAYDKIFKRILHANMLLLMKNFLVICVA